MLIGLASQLERRIDLLEQQMNPLLGRRLTIEDRRQAEHIVFSLQNVWEHFVRAFVLVSATGKAIGRSGAIPPSPVAVGSSPEAICHFLLVSTRRRYEPNWYRPTDAINAAMALQIRNLGSVAAAIGSTPWPLEDLRLVRNFFAHRSKSSALEVRALPWFPPGATIEVETALGSYATGGVYRFHHWCASAKAISKAML